MPMPDIKAMLEAECLKFDRQVTDLQAKLAAAIKKRDDALADISKIQRLINEESPNAGV